MNAVGVAMITAGAVLLIWLYGPVHAAALRQEAAPAYTGKAVTA